MNRVAYHLEGQSLVMVGVGVNIRHVCDGNEYEAYNMVIRLTITLPM